MHPRRISLTWGIFFINDGSKIDVKMSQITMCYVVCYKRKQVSKNNGIISPRNT